MLGYKTGHLLGGHCADVVRPFAQDVGHSVARVSPDPLIAKPRVIEEPP